MFRYETAWGDPAVRRFLAKIGPGDVDDLFALREADNAGSGIARDADDLPSSGRGSRPSLRPARSSIGRRWPSTATP